MADLSIANHGSVFLLSALTEAGEEWIAENIPADATRWAGAIVIEHRYIGDIAQGAVNDGLEISE